MPQVTKEQYRSQELADLKSVLETSSGRRLLWRIMGRCQPFVDYSPSMTVPELHRAIGARSIGLWLMHEVESNFPAWYNVIRNENSAENRPTIVEQLDDDGE